MRSHIARHHPAEKANYTPVYVQVFYHRTTGQPQLSYVEVRQDEDESEALCRAEPLGIPDDLDKLVGDHGFAIEKRDRNQFGDKFGAYYCIETVIDFEDLSPWLLKPTAAGFRELMKLSVAYLDNCLKDVKAGFQPILAKIMQYDDRKEFFHAVQQQQTVTKYGEIWVQVLWLACMAVMCDPPSIARQIVLTHEQTEHATELLGVIDGITAVISEEQSQQAAHAIGQLSTAILRQESASQLLVPRVINLLSLRPNGTFVQYGQITHSAAAITYCIRCTFIHSVVSRPNPMSRTVDIVDNEIKRFLNPTGSTPYSYCVQVHGACRTYGSKNALPTITWANSAHTALRLEGGILFTVNGLKEFSRSLLTELSFSVRLPTHSAKDLVDHYAESGPGYNFATEIKNKFDTQLLLKKIKATPELNVQYIRGESGRLLEKLFILMHMTYGSPARITEIATWLLSNTVHRTKSVYCHPRGLLFLGRYNKTTSMTGHERMIVHIVPREVEVIFIQYLAYVRPLASSSNHLGTSHILFIRPGMPLLQAIPSMFLQDQTDDGTPNPYGE
ncbi:hypothetical protein V1523DRAFT_442904 [Lipomyces doorenjongii]